MSGAAAGSPPRDAWEEGGRTRRDGTMLRYTSGEREASSSEARSTLVSRTPQSHLHPHAPPTAASSAGRETLTREPTTHTASAVRPAMTWRQLRRKPTGASTTPRASASSPPLVFSHVSCGGELDSLHTTGGTYRNTLPIAGGRLPRPAPFRMSKRVLGARLKWCCRGTFVCQARSMQFNQPLGELRVQRGVVLRGTADVRQAAACVRLFGLLALQPVDGDAHLPRSPAV
jgi:hypothetical protein